MLTPALKLPFTHQNQLVELLEQSGYYVKFDDAIKQNKGYKYRSFICKTKLTDICGCLIYSRETSDTFHASFSPDIRKLWKFWNLPKQCRLISDICTVLISNGAILIEDD